MKKRLLVFLFSLALSVAFAQDRIVKVNGEEMLARVLEITLEEILYRQPDSLLVDTLRVPVTEVFMVRFENGAKEVFAQNLPENKAGAEEVLSSTQYYLLGRQDAIRYYKGTGTLWGSAASSALLFPYGYAGSALLGLTPPKARKNTVSNVTLLSNPDYVRGYEEQARSTKGNKALAGAGIGTGVVLGAVLVMILTWR